MSDTHTSPSIPEEITSLFDSALLLPEGPIRTRLCDAIREVLVEHIARAAISKFLDDNAKYTSAEKASA